MTQDRQPAGTPAGGQFAATARPEAQLTLTVTIPAPEPVLPPDGCAPAQLQGVALSDDRGEVCGVLVVHGYELGFEALAFEGDQHLIEDPTTQEWTNDPDLSPLVGEEHAEEYAGYIKSMITAACAAHHKVGLRALDSSGGQIAAAINGEATALRGPNEDDHPGCANTGGHRFLGTQAGQPCIYCGVRSSKARPDNLDL